MVQHAAAFERMMKLYEWQPGQSAEPNADLFAPRGRWRPRLAVLLSAAAALALCAGVWWRTAQPVAVASTQSFLRVNERHALPDGSLIELKDGSRITTEFTAEARRVHLVGEAHFTVAGDAARPFVVHAAGVAVRAVGTAFNIRIEPGAVQILVTHGSVRVQGPALAAASAATETEIPLVSAGQRAIVNLSSSEPPRIAPVSTAEITEALDWQAPRLQFLETPLGVAIAQFNGRNATQIRLAQDDLAAIPIGGTFRVDNVESFVRALEVTLDLKAEPRGAGQIVLGRAR